jgi:hypothetical protein
MIEFVFTNRKDMMSLESREWVSSTSQSYLVEWARLDRMTAETVFQPSL